MGPAAESHAVNCLPQGPPDQGSCGRRCARGLDRRCRRGFHCGLPRAPGPLRPLEEDEHRRRRSRYLPRAFNRSSRPERVARPASTSRRIDAASVPSHPPQQWPARSLPASSPRWRLGAPASAPAQQNPVAAPDAAHRSRQPLSTRAWRASRGVMASMRLPARPSLINSTPPWTLGQGWTHASGRRCTPGLIHRMTQGSTLASMSHPAPSGVDITPVVASQKCADGLDQRVPFL